MKANLKFNNKQFIAEVSLSNVLETDENEIHDAYMGECMMNDAMFVNTAGMSTSDAKYMCGMSYMKNRQMLMEGAGELTEKQMGLPTNLKKGILKRYEKAGTLSEEGKKQLMSLSSTVEIEVKDEEEKEEENENESGDESENDEPKEVQEMEQMQAEPTAVFVQEPAPPSGNITPKAAEEGLKIDEKLQKQQEAAAPKNPQLQSPTFNPKA
jgi:hypothetical protein